MPRLILIETSTALCSTALVEGEQVVSRRESSERHPHASLTARFIKEMLEERGLAVSDCDAVCVSKGPGSYTGLRVGSSTAKGLCFGAGIPLISVGTLDLLAYQAKAQNLIPEGCSTVIPMIDARRMEVYAAPFSADCVRLKPVEPVVIDGNSFREYFEAGPVLVIGDAADKCREVLSHPGAVFVQAFPEAGYMAVPALEAYNEKRFENTAYFEPFYLKQFVATVSKKKLF